MPGGGEDSPWPCLPASDAPTPPMQPPHDAASLDVPVPLVVADDRFLTFQALVNVVYRQRLLVFYSMDQGAVAPYYDWFDRALAVRQPALAEALAAAGMQVHDKLIVWLQVRWRGRGEDGGEGVTAAPRADGLCDAPPPRDGRARLGHVSPRGVPVPAADGPRRLRPPRPRAP